MLIKEQIEVLRNWADADDGDDDLASADREIANTMEKMLGALQDIVDYHQDYHAPLNKDFEAIQDIAMVVLRNIDDPVSTGLKQS